MENVINILIIIFLPLLFIGIINKTKAFWGGRKGSSIFQPYFDFMKLLKKSEVISSTTSFVFIIFPLIYLATVLVASLLVPVTNHRAFINFDGNFILFAYLMALGRFFLIAGAMDTGSSFEGMGAAREINISTFVEPAFFILFASLGSLNGFFSFEKILEIHFINSVVFIIPITIAVIIIFVMILIEGSRLPIDDPNTHLELTMIHEVMVLDNSGPKFGLILYAVALKMILLTSIIANIIIPNQIGFAFSLLLYFVIVFIIAILIGTLESVIARFKMNRIPEFIFILTSLSLIILLFIIIIINKGFI